MKLKFGGDFEPVLWCYLKAITLVKELNPQVHFAVGNVCLVFWDEKNRICRMGKISYFLNCHTYDRFGDIDPYHHFCLTHLDNCGPDYWFGYKASEEKTRNLFCVETCRIESVKLFSNHSVSLIQLQRVIKVPKLKIEMVASELE